MPPLSALQQSFRDGILHGDPTILTHLAEGPGLDSGDRFGIYHGAYRARLEECLAKDFSALRTLVGDEAFSVLCERYVGAHPSDRPSLRWLGRHMARFLAEDPRYADARFLAEMAAFEWALVTAFDAADAATVDLAELRTLAPDQWPTLRLTPHPSVVRVPIDWNTPELWRAATDAKNAPSTPQRLEARRVCMVWREERITRFRTLAPDEAAALDAAARGANFAELCEALQSHVDSAEVPSRAARLLANWLREGIIQNVRSDPRST